MQAKSCSIFLTAIIASTASFVSAKENPAQEPARNSDIASKAVKVKPGEEHEKYDKAFLDGVTHLIDQYFRPVPLRPEPGVKSFSIYTRWIKPMANSRYMVKVETITESEGEPDFRELYIFVIEKRIYAKQVQLVLFSATDPRNIVKHFKPPVRPKKPVPQPGSTLYAI